MVKAKSIAENIPIMETTDIEYRAGCFANMRTPTPKMVVITDSMIDVLCVVSALSPVWYSFSIPFVIKML